ncbi:serine/threonine protein kinase, putative [Babesia caballi]|uniref:Serine/threonine protein kinase, putative n=1 Tax=Babesia caballi TaxID=5871 RepID=A0AAV4LP10_BABCB|nr:serine/threonine protein kinase, putative [Babesia caballi]
MKADALMGSCIKAFSGTRACGTRADEEFDALLERGVAKGKVLFKDVYLVSQLLNHYVNPHKRVVPGTPTTADCRESEADQEDECGEAESSCQAAVALKTGEVRSPGKLAISSSAEFGGRAATSLSSFGGLPPVNSVDEWTAFARMLTAGNWGSQPRMMPLYQRVPFLSLGNFLVFYRINEGASGKVHVGFHKLHRRTYALKVISKAQFNCDRTLFRRLKDEMSLAVALGHQNIVRTFEVLETASSLVIAMEYCDGGDVIGLIKDYSPMRESMARTVFRMVACGVQYLHASNICHRDIKPENIFLKRVVSRPGSGSTADGAAGGVDSEPLPHGMMRYVAKVGDFGAATRVADDRLLMDTVGTISYAAPEVLGCGGVMGYCGKSADIWSLGVLLYAMLFGELPWHNEDLSLREAVKRVLAKPLAFPGEASEPVIDLMTRMLSVNPSQRPTVDEVLSHPWVGEEGRQPLLVVRKIRPSLSKPT